MNELTNAVAVYRAKVHRYWAWKESFDRRKLTTVWCKCWQKNAEAIGRKHQQRAEDARNRVVELACMITDELTKAEKP